MGGGKPRWGVLILRGRLSVSGGREPPEMDGEKVFEDVDCGGEYAWGLGYPFCNGGLSVSNMCATICAEDYDTSWFGNEGGSGGNRTIVRTLGWGKLRGGRVTVAGVTAETQARQVMYIR